MPEPLPSLRLLPRLHYGLSAVAVLAAVAIAIPVAAGWRALGDAAPGAAPLPALGPPSVGGWIFLVGGALAAAIGVALAAALAVAGWSIASRRRRGFCLATSLAASFFFPLGTLLGFHTIAVLCRPDVREAFEPARRGAPT